MTRLALLGPRSFCAGAAALLLLALSTGAARAQAVGIRGGVTDDPDTVFLGGHVAFQGIGDVTNLRIEPALEFGVGDEGPVDFYTIRFGANVKYMFPVGSDVYLHPLLGASLYYFNIDDCGFADCDDLEAGIHLGGGFEVSGFGVDLYVGIEDVPDITIALMYTFF